MKERHMKILQAVIEAYIETGEPVSSKYIIRREGLKLSSATVRNDLLELVRTGYLEQPHTSSGRIPSEKGYRFYIDNLMTTCELEQEQVLDIEKTISDSNMNIDEFLKEALNMFSDLTGYTSAVVISHSDMDKIMKLEVIKTNDRLINLIVITKSGIVKNTFCRLYFLATDEEVRDLNLTLAEFLGETTLSQIEDEQFRLLETELAKKQQNWDFLIGAVKDIVSSIKNPKVIVGGQTKMLTHPEFYEIHKAKNVLSFLSDQSQLYEVLTEKAGDSVNIIVGSEIGGEPLSDVGLVIRKYRAENEGMYMLSLFGPKRMDYGKTMSQIEYFAKCIEKYLRDHEA